jgi:hypothetical protein
MEIFYPGISITEEIYWNFDFFKNQMLHPLIARWGWNRMANEEILCPIELKQWRRESERNLTGDMIHFPTRDTGVQLILPRLS